VANLALITSSKYLSQRWLAFWEFVDIPDAPDACWEWQGFCYPTGHGQFHFGRDMKASRAVWIMYHGPLETKDYICHKCDNSKCVRLDHLYKGTHQTNMADKIGKYVNRAATYVKLDWQQVEAIRSLNEPAPEGRKQIRGHLPRGMYSQLEVAKMFGISPTTVRRVWNEEERGGWRGEVLLDGEPSAHNQQ
jgi:HNH endonuclease